MFEVYSWHNRLPKETQDVYIPYLKLFFRVMLERQLIWKRRFIDKQERPWSNNRILRDNKFTNVYRELDKNSQWQIKNILLDDGLELIDLVWKMMVFRFFNNPNTFELGKELYGWRNGIPSYVEYDKQTFIDFIKEVRSRGFNPYTTAYLINSMATPGMPRDYCYGEVVIPTLHERIPELMNVVVSAKNPEEIITYLNTLPAVANFIAHEFYQDFTYIPRYTNRTFMSFDQNDYTNVGPGASVGIRLIYPSLVGGNQKEGIYRLRDIAERELTTIGKTIGENMPYLAWDKEKREYYITDECNITLHQIEMWLCEFQKYWKMMIGKGKQRSKFNPTTKDIIVK